jgi:membrane-associated phospholipid phosphatase
MHSLFQMEWDRNLLRHINADWHNSFLDWLLPFLRNADMWAPLYLFLILFVLLNCKKNGWWWLLAAVSTSIITNYTSSNLIKENIWRLRPCNDPALAGWLRTLPGIYLPESSSFTSSHAANHFGMAIFLFLTLKNVMGKWRYLFFVWAASICYAQMYIGVHYPFDIICGAAVGSMIGFVTASVFRKFQTALE